MEQGQTFRWSQPKFPTADANHRILQPQRSRFTHYLGPMVMLVASFFPFQATYYLNGHSFIEQEMNRNKIGFRNESGYWTAKIEQGVHFDGTFPRSKSSPREHG